LRRTPPAPVIATAVSLLMGCALLPDGPTSQPEPERPSLSLPSDDRWFASGRAAVAEVRARPSERRRARNVVLFVGDGMGVSTVTAARILQGQLRGEPGEENLLAFERLPHTALAKTYNTNQQVPDSAGTMTAMMSGVKTKAGVLGVSDAVLPRDHRSVETSRVPTLLERAEARGLATGIVSTARITHATPAACYAHTAHRDWEDDAALPEAARQEDFPDIARQLLEWPFGDHLEVAMGGGRRHFLPAESSDPEHPDRSGRRLDGRDLAAEWSQRGEGWHTVFTAAELEALDPESTSHLLGLFEPSHMQWEADRADDPGGEPSLAAMTAKALEILARSERGYFLVVEAGRIDHGHHASNAYRALTDTVELSEAVDVVLREADPAETLVVVTADHSHVLTLGGYPTRGNDILGLVVPNGPDGSRAESPARDGLGLPYTTLGYQNGPGYPGASGLQPEGAKRFPHFAGAWQGVTEGRPDLTRVDVRSPSYLQEAAVPLRAETHAGEDVPVYAGGAGSWLFRGVREQHYVHHAIEAALGWSEP